MVEPLKPQARLFAAQKLTEAELAEFDRLLSARFETDPSVPLTRAQREEEERRQRRLQELSDKITGAR